MSPAVTCPRCRRSTNTPFSAAGLCLRCAGIRALAIDLDEPADTSEPPAAAETERTALPARIGPYEIIDELGRGGMARVFCARQPRLDRLVALKVLAGGPASETLEQRFLREIQTVARLRHPNIVAIHDSGRADGYVYFAMDYVEGGDLAHRLRERAFAPREIAALLEKIARALHYAHGEGVIHRDLKPSNILLDGTEPRLADFGLAAQIEAGGDLTMVSAILGTPHYLAPEAVRGGSAALSPASDLYALGVILYEALSGRTPFAGASAAELPALLANTDPPPLRLLAPATPRDLETICLQCLERDPARRYGTTGLFADDLARLLKGEPITARPPGAGERFRRFARKHRTAFAAAAAATVTLVAGLAVSTTLTVRARKAEKRAAREAAAATAVVDFLKDDLLAKVDTDSQNNPEVTLRAVLEQAAKHVGERFATQPEVEAPIQEVIGVTFTSLGQYPIAQRHLERAAGLARPLYGAEDLRTLTIENELASVFVYQREHEKAAAEKTRLLAQHHRLLGPDHRASLNIASDLAAVYGYQGKLNEAVTLLRDTIAREERTFGPNDPSTVNSMSVLGVNLTKLGRLREAAEVATETLKRSRIIYPEGHQTTIVTLTNLAGIYGRLNETDKARPLMIEAVTSARKTLPAGHPTTLNAMNSLAVLYYRAGQLAEAEELFGQVLEGRRRMFTPGHPQILNTLISVAGVHRERGRLDDAIKVADEVVAGRTRQFGPDHQDTARALDFLASCLADLGRHAEALPKFQAALAGRRKSVGEEHAETHETYRALALCLLHLGRPSEAESLLRESLPTFEKAQTGPWQPALTRIYLGAAIARQQRLAEAAPLLREGADALGKVAGKMPAGGRARVLAQAASLLNEFGVPHQLPKP